MKAVICTELTGPEGLTYGEIEPPAPAANEVLIEVEAASLNFIDLLIARGLYQGRSEPPYVVGAEGVGTIVEVGADVTGWKPGMRVATFEQIGAWAELVVAKHWRVVPVPDAVPSETAAAVLHNYVTAGYSLKIRGNMQPGETLLVHGATGGVGLACVELGKLWGATVIGTVGSDEKAALAREYGADNVINYQTDDFRKAVLDITQGSGADVIFDPVGGEVFDLSMRCINWDGRILVIGFAAGTIGAMPLNRPLLKSASVVGVNTGLWPDKQPEAFQAFAREIFGLVAADKVRPKIQKVLPLEDFAEAVEALDTRTAQGRYVFRVG